MFNSTHITQSAIYALVASLTGVSMLAAFFFVTEPAITHGQTSDEFLITATINDESSFSTNIGTVNMIGDGAGNGVNGLTGGYATGTADFIVFSNNAAGYTVDISFANNGTPNAFVGDDDASEALRDYEDGGAPTYGMTASSAAQFAYTATSAVPTHTSSNFNHDGSSACGSGEATAPDGSCWMGPSTSNYTIVDTSSTALTGATSTIIFKLVVPSGAVPVPAAQDYTATATLSLTVK
jgi:hypothetical protein